MKKSKKYIKKSKKQSIENTQSIQQQQHLVYLYGKFLNFLEKQKFKKLKSAMQNYIGRNTPIIYRTQFDFREQWQTIKKSIQANTTDFLNERHFLTQIISFLILGGFCSLIWFISFQRVFQQQQLTLTKSFYILGILITATYLILKLIFSIQTLYRSMNAIQILQIYFIDILMVIYFVINLIMLQNFNHHTNSLFSYCIDLCYIFISYKRCSQIYKSFKMKIITSTYKDHFKMFDLFATSLTVAHIFALILFSVTKFGYDDQRNWLIKADIDQESPKIQYIYAMYFACTTMFTVGYGDMTPANQLQVTAVLCIQIFGIAIFGYVLNQIGHTLSIIRKQQQSLEKDLSSLSKISKYYDLDNQLTSKARNFIIHNQTSIEDLLPEEQRQLLLKLNDDLRTEINQENSFRIIKSSLFFVCHWSKKMQSELAKRLTKKIFTPNQKLLQIPGKQCIYIIKKGKVQIYTDKQSGMKRCFKRLLKTIQSNDHLQVSHNVYGYVATICSHPIKLKAISKDFTVVYMLEKNDFYESLMDTQSDVEYYHQIKTRLDLEKNPESYQTPDILNIREHYRPNILHVIKKNRKLKKQNQRVNILRDQNRQKKRRAKLVFYSSLQEFQENGNLTSSYHQNKSLMTEEGVKQEEQLTNKLLDDSEGPMNYTMVINKTQILAKELKMRLRISELTDTHKQYVNYFCRFNLSVVLQKFDITFIKERNFYKKMLKSQRGSDLSKSRKMLKNSQDD